MRISKDKYYLNIAKSISERSTCIRAKCGTVLVNIDAIISTGYNGNPRNQSNCCDVGKCPRENYAPNEGRNLCNAVHGEMNCIVNLVRVGGGSSINSVMYVWFKRLDNSKNSYDKPCGECMKLILNSGIKRIINYTEDNYHTTLHETIIDNGELITKDIKGEIKIWDLNQQMKNFNQ